VLHRLSVPPTGTFVPPTLIRVDGIQDMDREIFGPVLHVATFKSTEIDAVIDAINATGYGLTFGLQTRIDDRVQHVSERIEAGNIYVNRNQIGAIVGSQPFGGEGLSGTGPKAGGPTYLERFRAHPAQVEATNWTSEDTKARLQTAIASATPTATRQSESLPGPTGESNVLTSMSRGPILCLGPGAETAERQAESIQSHGGTAVLAEGSVPAAWLAELDIDGAIWWGDTDTGRAYRAALAQRSGAILPLVTGLPDKSHACGERHVCVDTTASGGNAQLLGGMS
jgi:Delta 1-pyrroline-5-carboxylate dehydrogenase